MTVTLIQLVLHTYEVACHGVPFSPSPGVTQACVVCGAPAPAAPLQVTSQPDGARLCVCLDCKQPQQLEAAVQRLLQLLPQGVVLSVVSDISSLSAAAGGSAGTGPRRNSLQLMRGMTSSPGPMGAPSPSAAAGGALTTGTRLAAPAMASTTSGKGEQQA
jgi:hypothetical protein